MNAFERDFFTHSRDLNYNERGTAWVVQKVKFEDTGTDNIRLSFGLMASFPTFDEAYRYFGQFCSGLQDDGGVCENQNHGHASFYRIVEIHER